MSYVNTSQPVLCQNDGNNYSVSKLGLSRFLKGVESGVCNLPSHLLPLKCNPNLNHMNYSIMLKTTSFHSEQTELCEIENYTPERVSNESRCQAGLRSSGNVYSIIRTRQLSVEHQ